MLLKNISLKGINKEFSSNSGLILIQNIWEELHIEERLNKILPKKIRNRGQKQVNKFKTLLFSFIWGADCLDDIDVALADNVFYKLVNSGINARRMGDFLRSFNNYQIEQLQNLLVRLAMTLRLSRHESDNDFILTMDATPHEHYAKKKEGMAFNYKNYWCLDSQNAYDQHGYSYVFDLRHGNTHSGKDSELWIHRVFSQVPAFLNRWFRADSAYGRHSVYEALQTKKVSFVIALKRDVGNYVRKRNKNLLSWRKTKLEFFDSDKCEVAMGLYPTEKYKTFRVVMIRAPKEGQMELWDNLEEDGYDYYYLITNISSFDMSEEEIFEFYRDRSNAENYIREQKYNFDFLNFPCKKLRANKVFGLAGTMAHNFMRFLSFCMRQKIKRVRGKDKKVRTVVQHGYFAKKVRNILMKLPCQVVRHARKMELKMNLKSMEVLRKIMTDIQLSFSKVSEGKT